MADLFAVQFPQNVNTTLIYDAYQEYYRPFTDKDFVGGLAGVDSFGRQRVSNPEMIFNSKQLFDNQPLYWNDIEFSGSGTSSTYSSFTASSTLSVSANTAGKRIRQTYMRFNYQPSKSQLVFLTGVLKKSGGGNGIISRMGIFDDDNGIFLQRSGSTISLVVRSSVSGSVSDSNSATQANWNIDTMDGNGLSHVELDFSKSQILVIDFEWLGVGCVRIGFVVDGKVFYCHQFNHANNISGVYMSTPNLPLRYEIQNSGVGVASSIECICGAVISEGGKEDIGTNLYLSTGTSPVSLTKAQLNAFLGWRLKSDYKGCTIDILDTVMYVSSIDAYEWRLILNPSVAGTFTFTDVTGAPLQKAVGNGTTNIASGGTVVAGGYGTSRLSADSNALKSLLKLGSSINGTMDTMVLCVYPLGNNALDGYASVNYRAFL
ncbi:MAG: Puniceispirillum phage [Bacteroidota bacterium]|jgi:hypothetical protein